MLAKILSTAVVGIDGVKGKVHDAGRWTRGG